MRPELRQKWIAAGYSPTMGSAEVVPPPPRGIRRVYHFTSAKHAKKDIQHSRIKVARIADLNDPFELLALNFEKLDDREFIREFKNTHNQHTGLLCFSKNWTSPVLWSHYADKHCGICLGFDIDRLSLRPVSYIGKRAFIPLDPAHVHDVLEELKYFILCTKYDHWIYEEEFRYFVPLSDTVSETVEGKELQFYPFGPALRLAEVILGPFCDTTRNDVQRLMRCRYDNVVIFKTRLATQWFAVVPDENDVNKL